MADELTPWSVAIPPPSRKTASWQPSFFGLLRLLLPILAAGGVMAALHDRDRARAAALLAHHLIWLPLVILPFAAGMALDACSLWLILRCNGQPLSYWSVLRVRMAAEGALFTLPAGSIAAEALKPSLLRRACGVPLATGAAAVAVNKAFIVITNGAYLLLGLVFGGAFIQSVKAKSRWGEALPALTLLAAGACLALGFGLLVLLRRADLLERLGRLLPRRWRERLERGAADRSSWRVTVDGFFRRDGLPATCCALSLLHWLTEAFETYAVVRLLGLSVGVGATLGFESLMALARSLAFFLPGAIGVQDSGHLLLVNLSGAADATAVGVAFILVKRFKELVWTIVAALLNPGSAATLTGAPPIFTVLHHFERMPKQCRR